MFTITVENKAFHFQAKDPNDREEWINSIQKCADTSPYLAALSTSGASGPFARKLAELDAFLQLMLDNIHNLEVKISNDSSVRHDAAHKVVYQAKKFADSIKYSIVLLQMAEANIDQSSSMPDLSILQIEEPVTTINPDPPIESTSILSSDEGSDGDQDAVYADDLDDIFFDAVDSVSMVSEPPKTGPDFSPLKQNKPFPMIEDRSRSSITIRTAPPPKNQQSLSMWDKYDACCDQEDMEERRVDTSIFMHLLSQVKIGMDLTRVTLPTFILERRSFLEMIADFLAHPDFFADIAKMDTAEDRMLQTVKWYLSAFHAGRRTLVPKKPYNPILGEVFYCFYSLDENDRGGDFNSEKPVPWANYTDVCFIAEQVSHHPPVSAYYAEHIPNQIEIEGSIWTKSRFLGMSVSVHMVGLTRLRLLQYGEEYIMTFPSAYGRSIFSIPWFELGGKVYIECKQTGYRSDIDFQTKPFYGGKKNRVLGTISHDRRTLYTIDGEWNDRIYIRKMAPDSQNMPQDIFFDVKTSVMIPKRIKSIKDQDENESRRLWKDVTYFLCTNHLDKATEAKRKLEDRQRKEAAERLESSELWKPRHFSHCARYVVDGVAQTGWTYCRPLSKRLR
ncbi:hypothetical protein ACOME3_005469 [Neoechinorhynchus agilis]